ncbi:hypothetical protein JM18_000198 [Phytophthora kernoviae]|uniref:Uncharacterized protein n=2 Tax=Phytophthora kernoviae TaxID=325452 RepID=A0A8T0MA17_9STRA|nr:hypothetical protein G195_002099 [Phytophthora kernoviae 00238/432]KAG2533105.1 hypothetical protein JM16_000155 [Phytophthora kernoviae]KAG2533367.1 hypothetical protein JM18_000198 [Phytophthora kernoviae]
MENAAYEFQQVQDEVKKITLEIPEKVLTGQTYHASDVHQWTVDISSQCLKELKGVANGSAGFKYIGALLRRLVHNSLAQHYMKLVVFTRY